MQNYSNHARLCRFTLQNPAVSIQSLRSQVDKEEDEKEHPKTNLFQIQRIVFQHINR